MTRPRRPVVTLKRLETIRRVLERLMPNPEDWKSRAYKDFEDAQTWIEGMILWKESRKGSWSKRARNCSVEEQTAGCADQESNL